MNAKVFVVILTMSVFCVFMLLSVVRTHCSHKSLVPLHLWPLLLSENDTRPRPEMTVDQVQWSISTHNSEMDVWNIAEFGPITPDTPIIAILTRQDLERIQYLIISLAQVRNIEKALLVFSHTSYDERYNDLIARIQFCRVTQIFFPYSVQLYRRKFPGTNEPTCIDGENEEDCLQKRHFVEEKHHWWWTAHQVFGSNPRLRRHKGYVIFVSEASYIFPDLLFMMTHMENSLPMFPEVKILSLGRQLPKQHEYNKLTIDTWRPVYANGMAFNRTVWRQISNMTAEFCDYDDASWSYSLLKVLSLRRRAVTVACKMPRVVSTASYGSGRAALSEIVPLTQTGPFPPSVEVGVLYNSNGLIFDKHQPPPAGNGGWTDPRDKLLCRNISKGSTN